MYKMHRDTPGVEGIEVFGHGLGDGPCLTPTEQNWEDVGPVEMHLSVCIYVEPLDILLKEAAALSGDPNTPQYLGLTSSIVQSQRPEVDELVHQVDILCCHLDRRPGPTWFPDLLNLCLCPIYLEASFVLHYQ